jgi:hypothetical protein
MLVTRSLIPIEQIGSCEAICTILRDLGTRHEFESCCCFQLHNREHQIRRSIGTIDYLCGLARVEWKVFVRKELAVRSHCSQFLCLSKLKSF